MARIQLILNDDEVESLAKWAFLECRDPRDQARYVLRKEMKRLGLLEPDILEGGNSNEENNDAK
ncbi:MAG: hypothetical protein H6657_23465 [Ardenticatenaceae bacterium]|nr:hypothetical protein [Ardenticatenaceae bacterium]